MTCEKSFFRLVDYDAYGFDLDHTLAKFNLVEQIQLTYNAFVSYLIEKAGFNEDLRCDVHEYKDFITKGLFIDTAKGNIIKISHKGKILRASHGTKMLSEVEIDQIYGKDRIWDHFQDARDAVKTRSPKKNFLFWETYFDIPVTFVCAKMVDSVDKKNGGPLASYDEVFWNHIPECIYYNYRHQAFAEVYGNGFFPSIKSDPQKFYRKCSQGVRQWLGDLKQDKKCVFLTTSSHIDFAELTASQTIGPDWKDFFDVIITNARKPGFFTDNNPFLELDGITEMGAVSEIHQHGVYSSGNQAELEQLITKITEVEKPKVVYFGDSLCSDAFPVKSCTNWDVVLVLEEMEAEGYHPQDNTHHYLEPDDWEPDEINRKFVREVNLDVDPEEEAFILSKTWGSFFYHPEEDSDHDRHMNTFFGELITKYTDIAIPSIEYIAGLPLDHKFPRFDHSDDGNTDGFSPAKPKPLLQYVPNSE